MKSSKHQHPSTREIPSTKHQFHSDRHSCELDEIKERTVRFEVEVWSFTGAWMLVLGASIPGSNVCSIAQSASLRQIKIRTEMGIKVSIVEDSRGTRESLTELIGRAPGLRCVGAHANGEAAL